MTEEKINILLSKYYKDECSVEEMTELQRQLADDHLKEAMLLRVFDRIEESERYHTAPVEFDKSRVLDGIKTKLDLNEVDQPGTMVPTLGARSNSLRFLRVAASVCLIALTAWFIYTNQYPSADQVAGAPVDQWKEIETLRGQTKTISLPDGSEIKLNVDSKIRFQRDFANHQVRKIYLDGEAFFDVARMPEKPFVVLARGIETSVLGTSFNIDASKGSEEVHVAVVTGKVKVGELEGKDLLYLEPDEMATWGDSKIVKTKYDPDLVLAWTRRALVFKKSSFSDVIQRLENWYDVDIQVNGKILSNDYSGVHNDESLEVLLKGLGFAGNFTFKIDGKKVTITPN